MSRNQKQEVAKFKGERLISFKSVPKLPDLFLDPPSDRTVRNWASKGVWVDKKNIKLRSRREGRKMTTSVEAVEEFLEKTNP